MSSLLSVDRQGDELLSILTMISNINNSQTVLGAAVSASYITASNEMVELESLSSSALTARQRVQHLLAAVNNYVVSTDVYFVYKIVLIFLLNIM